MVFGFEQRREGQAPLEAGRQGRPPRLRRGPLTGQAALTAVMLLLGVSLVIVLGFSAVALRESRISRQNLDAKLSYYLSEAAVEDAYYRIQNGMVVSSSETITLDGRSAIVTITQSDPDTYTIVSTGDVSSAIRRVYVDLTRGIGASFSYGAQVGYLGLHLENSPATISGSVYANGPVSAKNGGRITGDAWVASRPSLDQYQSNQTAAIGFRDAAGRQDFAQSFKPSITAEAKEVRIWMRKVGNPSGGTSVHIREDDGTGKPETGAFSFGSGSFNPSDVAVSFQPVTIFLSGGNPVIEDTTYWVILDGGSWNAANYYEIAADVDGSYATGTAQWSEDWRATIPSWTPTNLDARFELHLDTDVNAISGINSAGIIIEQDAHAYAVGQNANICGNASYQTTIASGSLDFLNDPTTQYCPEPLSPGTAYPNTVAPGPQDMPLDLAEIQRLVDRADRGGTYTGDLILPNNQTATLGPTEITGDVSLDSGSVLTMTGDLHVVGNFSCNQGEVRLDPGFGEGSGVIIVDGTASIVNNCDLKGSGHPDSYLMVLSRYPARSSGPSAIHLKDLTDAIDKAIIYAHFGEIFLENNLTVHQVTGAKVNLKNQAEVIYESGLANVKFTSGPTGGWEVESWQEIP